MRQRTKTALASGQLGTGALSPTALEELKPANQQMTLGTSLSPVEPGGY